MIIDDVGRQPMYTSTECGSIASWRSGFKHGEGWRARGRADGDGNIDLPAVSFLSLSYIFTFTLYPRLSTYPTTTSNTKLPIFLSCLPRLHHQLKALSPLSHAHTPHSLPFHVYITSLNVTGINPWTAPSLHATLTHSFTHSFSFSCLVMLMRCFSLPTQFPAF